jgi:hypothetical protein
VRNARVFIAQATAGNQPRAALEADGSPQDAAQEKQADKKNPPDGGKDWSHARLSAAAL